MISIFIGVLLNIIFGYIPFITHPIVLIGKMITFFETKLYDLKLSKKVTGLILLILVSSITFIIPFSILYFIKNGVIKIIIESLMILEILAIKGLKDEPMKVYKALINNNMDLAKKELSMLVTRDTSKMTKNQIIMSTIETIAENIVDAIISPLFFIIIGGAPLGFFYKAVNTLDSMVGYKNERYSDFGYFSAKFDDVLNFIPARITPIFIFISVILMGYNFKESFKVFIEDRKKSSSPNSGYSEAPIAGALEIYFGGELQYFDKVVNKPKIGFKDKFKVNKIIDSTQIMIVSSFVGLLILVFFKIGVSDYFGL